MDDGRPTSNVVRFDSAGVRSRRSRRRANQQPQDIIDYLREENRVLREQLGNRRLSLKDGQRRRLAVRAKRLGHKLLSEVASIVTPDTLLRRHRTLIARKYDGS